MNKMVINHLDKLFVTSDASTIVNELDVFHPAAKLLVMAAKAQAGEVGDGTNLVGSLSERASSRHCQPAQGACGGLTPPCPSINQLLGTPVHWGWPCSTRS
jgi:hypothetical protein